MDKDMFWTVLKADLIFGVCSIIVTTMATLAFAFWRKKRLKSIAAAPPKPQVIVLGGKSAEPAHCPLCGQGWPLPGPGKQEPSSA